MGIKLSFHGADRGVTGSCHMIECMGRRVLVDCGFFQGGAELAEENARPFGFDPKEIDTVLLTHAHLDHCGRLPLLVKRGFRGEIISTTATRELARLVMLDSADLQEEDARDRARKSARRGVQGKNGGALYTVSDAMATLDFLGRCVGYGQPIQLADGLRATYIDAGHILGSASILLEIGEGSARRTVLFSGDIGNLNRPILRNPTPPPPAEVVIMESTYGDRLHKGIAPSVEEFYEAIRDGFKRGGNIIIPTFALERAQELLYYLREGIASGKLTKATQVYLDSPMAISATEIFRKHPECYDPPAAQLFREGQDPFNLPGLHFTRQTADSMAINQVTGGAIIMAGSGMATGGRVRHHLKHNLWREDSTVIIVGYAAVGTLARQIIDHVPLVHIFGEEIPVRARVYTIGGFSAHADQAELLAWHKPTGAGRTFLVHGEESAMKKLAPLLPNTNVEMPALDQSFDL